MPSIVEWLVSDRVILTYPHGIMTLDDLQHESVQIQRLVEASTYDKLLVLLDVRHVQQHPFNLREIMKNAAAYHQPKLAEVVLISDKPMLKVMTKFIMGVTGTTVRAFEHPADALVYIQQQDAALTLPSVEQYTNRLDTIRTLSQAETIE